MHHATVLLAAFAGPVAVAYSGGADSALVLAAAVRARGAGGVVAVTALSPSYPADELGPARRLAADLGVRHELVDTHELDSPGYRANTPQRCWFCKSEVLDRVSARAASLGVATVATGTNADDARDPFRPGIRAGDERGVLTPLRDLGLTKTDVRELSRHWGLPTWSKPATPCLASRIRHGIPVTSARLARVDRAERAVRDHLRRRGLTVIDLRVRDLGEAARVDLDAALVPLVAHDPELLAAVRAAGLTGPLTVAAFASGALSRAAAGAEAGRSEQVRTGSPGGGGSVVD